MSNSSFQIFVRQLLSALLQLCFVAIVARMHGPAGSGVFALILMTTNIFGVLGNLGLATGNIYYVAAKKTSYESALGANLVTLSIIGLVTTFLLLGLLLFEFIPQNAYLPQDKFILNILCLYPALFVSTLPSLLLAKERFFLFNVATIAQPLFCLIFGVLSLVLFGALQSLISAYVLSLYCSAALQLALAFSIKFPRLASWLAYIRMSTKYSMQSHLSNVASLLNYRITIAVLAAFSGNVAAGLFSIAIQVVEKIWLPSQAISSVIMPRYSATNQQSPNIEHALVVMRITFYISALIALALAPISEILIVTLFGDAFRPAATAAILMLPGVVMWASARILATYYASQGRSFLNLIFVTLTVAMNTCLALILVEPYGLWGVAAGTSTALTLDLIFRIIALKAMKEIEDWKMIIPRFSDLNPIFSFFLQLKIRN